jgi:hypothetical protein
MAEDILIGMHNFLLPYLPLINSHNVDYLTRDHWHVYMPESIRQSQHVDLYDLYEQRYEQSLPVATSLDAFIDQIVQWRKRIEQVTWTRERFNNEIFADSTQQQTVKSSKYVNRTFMSEKKEHEVDILAPVIDQIATLVHADSVIHCSNE